MSTHFAPRDAIASPFIWRRRSTRSGCSLTFAIWERSPGFAICPQTPVELLQDVIEDCETVLVMSVNPGFSGQKFLARAFEKVREARALIDRRNPACLIEVDGGVGAENARELVEAGADVLVMGSAIFGAPDPAAELRRIRALVA